MQLYRLKDVQMSEDRLVFRHGAWRGLLGGVLAMAAITAYVAVPKGEATNPVLIAVPAFTTLLLFAVLIFSLRACFKPGNWLLAATQDGLYINLRSLWNAHLPEESHCVVHVAAEEVAAIGKTEETCFVPVRRGYDERRFMHIDIYLKQDSLAGVVEALRAERRVPGHRRLFAPPKTLHYPVRTADPSAIRLVWDWIRPGEDRAIALLSSWYPIAPSRSERMTPWESLPEPEQRERIGMYYEMGYEKEAIRLARLKFGMRREEAIKAFAQGQPRQV